jgi:hypothetical protein
MRILELAGKCHYVMMLHHEKWPFFDMLMENHLSGIESVLGVSLLFDVWTLDTCYY